MSTWTLESLNAQSKERNDNYGHDFHVFYKLRYTPSTFGRFVEPPKLDWHEKCYRIDHTAGEWYMFDLNLYDIKPQSHTLKPWSRRYIEAYRSAVGTTNRTDLQYGSVQLLDRNGAKVQGNTLGANIPNGNPQGQADAVRSYLKRHGGILVIEIHDNPGCALPVGAAEHVERLLIFDVGVVGGGPRQQAEQHWIVNGATGPNPGPGWQRSFQHTWGNTFSTRGFNKVATPANLVTPMPPAFSAGEYA